jgi:hypothetical protein
MKKKIIEKWHKKVQKWSNDSEKKEWGKGTIVFDSWEDFEHTVRHEKGLVSPGGAASMLGVTRSYISQMEKEGKITVYRIWAEDVDWDSLPFWVKALVPRREMYGFITVDEVERIKNEMIRKAEDRIKRLKGK